MSIIAAVRQHYSELASSLQELCPSDRIEATRKLIRTDLYYLLRYVLQRTDVEHPWMLARIRDVQNAPDGYIDLWARDHRKSTIITYAKTIQDILASHGEDPLPEWEQEATFGIFSHTRPIAKAFLRQIKAELEGNELLLDLFPDVLYRRPDRDAPWWSEDNGIVVRRKTNPKEATVEAWGLVDGSPTSKHFMVLIYDDVVVPESVTNPEMIEKTTNAWSVSLNLGVRNTRVRMIGTRYHNADTYRAVMDREAAIPRIHPATDDGTLTGAPIYLTQKEFDDKVRKMGPYVASAQLLQRPEADSKQTFNREWLRHYRAAENWKGMNRALLCDPATEKKKTSDYTVMAVAAKGPDHNYYLLDILRDRLNLQERAQAFLAMHRKWKPQKSGYEKYGKDSDISYIKEVQDRDNYRFDIVELAGNLSKPDRINRLIPVFFEGRFYLPTEIHRTGYDKKPVELINVFIEQEFTCWPVPVHDDMLDCIARIFDIELAWPKAAENVQTDRYSRDQRPRGSWMSA